MENWNIGFWKRNISDFILFNKFRFSSDDPVFREPIFPSFHNSIIPAMRECHPPASPVRRNLRMRESGTVNSDGGQAAAAQLVICYWLFVIWIFLAAGSRSH
ncbi:MAG: hypothetical protein PVH28_13510 [Desulfobacterales bacterium]|jgi:hypothetical protein